MSWNRCPSNWFPEICLFRFYNVSWPCWSYGIYIEFLRSPLYIAIIYSYFTLSQEKTSVTSLNHFPRIFQLGTCWYIFKTDMANCIDVSNTKSKRDNSFPLVFRIVGGIDRVFVYVMLSFKHRSIPNHMAMSWCTKYNKYFIFLNLVIAYSDVMFNFKTMRRDKLLNI